MSDLERRALLGDRKAQEECTRQGIALPCPCCGEKVEAIMHGQCVYHVRASCPIDSRFTPLSVWNTRPAPPVGRCGECAAYIDSKCANTGYYKSETGFCDDFAPKEDT